MTTAPVSTSRAPVGSSARITLGPRASARAMATRCCSPPDSRPMDIPALSFSPTASSSSRAREPRRQKAAPWSYRSGAATFSVVVSPAMRLKDWNTNPKVCPRRWARRLSPRPATSTPFSWYPPEVGTSMRPRMLSSVDLPVPDRPTTATCSPGCTSRSTPVRILSGGAPGTEKVRVMPRRCSRGADVTGSPCRSRRSTPSCRARSCWACRCARCPCRARRAGSSRPRSARR